MEKDNGGKDVKRERRRDGKTRVNRRKSLVSDVATPALDTQYEYWYQMKG